MNVPASENEVVDIGQRYEVLDHGNTLVGALPEADGAHLGQRPKGFGPLRPDGFDTGDKRRGNSAHPRNEHTKLTRGGGDLRAFLDHCDWFSSLRNVGRAGTTEQNSRESCNERL